MSGPPARACASSGSGAVGAGLLAVRDSQVSPGVLGFVVVALLGVATWLLVRSMSRQIRKIDFSEDAIDRERRAVEPPTDTGHGAAGGAGESEEPGEPPRPS